MQQQINLYKLLPKKSKPFITRKKLMVVYGVFMCFLILQFLHALWYKHKLAAEYEQQLLLLSNAKKKILKLTEQYPNVDTKNIQSIGENLRAALNNELKILKLLTQSSMFSTYMQDIAEASIPNVWLTSITFSAGDPRVILNGNALQAMLAQQFLDQLTQKSSFSMMPFKINELMKKNIENTDIVSFNIATAKVKN